MWIVLLSKCRVKSNRILPSTHWHGTSCRSDGCLAECYAGLFCFKQKQIKARRGLILFFLTGWAIGPRVGSSSIHSREKKFILDKFTQQIFLKTYYVPRNVLWAEWYSNEKIVKCSLFMGLVWHISISSHRHLIAMMTMALGNCEARWRLQTDALGSNFS